MIDSSCGPIQTKVVLNEKMAKSLDLFKEHGSINQNIISIVDSVIPEHVRKNVQ